MKTLDKKCIHPWSHLAFTPNGDIWPCCHQRVNPTVLGNIDTDNLSEVFNGDKMKQIRLDMMNGKLPEGTCDKCAYFESIPSKSPRQNALGNDYAQEVIDSIPNITNQDGSVNQIKIKYWDLRFSNLCNLSCVMCSPEWSSKWTQEVKNIQKKYTHKDVHSMLHNMPKPKEKVTKTGDLKWVDENINDVEKIYFAGGEPLLMDEHWYIINKLDELQKYNVKIKYNTNMMQLDYKGQSVVDIWKKWHVKNLVIEGSLDETGARAEWIRYGSHWPTIEKNIKTLVDAGVRAQFITSVACYNVFRLPELIQELYDLFASEKVQVVPIINPVFNQQWHIDVLPDELKQQSLKKIKKFVDKHDVRWRGQFRVIYDLLSKPHNPENAKRFLRASALLDSHRGTSIFDAIPELEVVNSMYDNLYEKFKEEIE